MRPELDTSDIGEAYEMGLAGDVAITRHAFLQQLNWTQDAASSLSAAGYQQLRAEYERGRDEFFAQRRAS